MVDSLRRTHTVARAGAAVLHLASPAASSRRGGASLWAMVSAGLSPTVLVGGWLLSDALQPDRYSPVRQRVSVLAGYGGTDRWIMTGALLVVGSCHLITVWGLRAVRTSARITLAVAGLAAFGVAVFPEPARGSTSAHLAWTALGAVAIAVWPAFVGARRWPAPHVASVQVSTVATCVFLALLAWLVIAALGAGAVGLAERVSSSIQTCWPIAVVIGVRFTHRSTTRPGPVRP